MNNQRFVLTIFLVAVLTLLLYLLFSKRAKAAEKEPLPPGEAKSRITFNGYPADMFTNIAGFKVPRCAEGFHPEWHPELEGGSDGGWWCVMDIAEAVDLLRMG